MPNLIGYISSSIARDSLVGAGRKCVSGSAFKLPTARKFNSGRANSQWQALTWTTQHPDRVTPENIAPSFAHFAVSQATTVPILFASPEFTAWTEPTGSLLPRWVTPLLDHVHAGDAPKVAYTIAAVVDKISGNNDAREGLSLLLADSSHVTASIATPARLKSNASEEPAFFLTTNVDRSSQSSHEVGLRLARTVFRNGRDRTLLGMRWTRDEPSNSYILDGYHDLSSCSVTSPVHEACCAVNVPFHPVTQRRRVISSMGNILRQVSKSTTDDGMSAGIPASSELEKELPRYVNERGIPHQRVAVWALVEPSTSSMTNTSDRDVQGLLIKGSKLHRVVSGGGGWGKKQGLLSLDPEVSFGGANRLSREASLDQTFASSTETPAAATDFPDFLEGLGLEENISSLSQVAPPGDYIQFFVTSESDNTIPSRIKSKPRTLTYSFGVDAPDESTETSPTASGDITVLQNHFGAVSESAISYSRKDLSGEAQCETKISVPGSRINLSIV
ncbi:conserved hypothetical protein [Talaromyces stipitatus ATCC 10500]|uniref:V-type ATPase, C subunit family protein n=1 Tax=Talaromyces stipitatus (strain ATCC 10500 / CBS 375.48 / QM 6759 / NRRL 1006) TaxID=441959 RepID=B8MPE7_TALSN|nr:uncharacterized protein TSTA_105950 [Talaromyces stipitatus ATCC 10500]EED14386.1 conserved hypothetical protein [Talaromyces stipitatus ATCC 10500]